LFADCSEGLRPSAFPMVLEATLMRSGGPLYEGGREARLGTCVSQDSPRTTGCPSV
jgi:hypothetical protein